VKIAITDRSGVAHVVEGRDGWTMMETIRDAGLPIAAECGGACACATCHVYVDPDWAQKLPSKDESEIAMLDVTPAVEERSRLSCQITLDDKLDGIRVTLAPEH
jgi:ferredoxin, 2Fe-2S